MARIRTIKPEFWTDRKVVGLSPYARLLFVGSWNFAMCDDGHLVDDPFSLKLQVLPADAVDADQLVDELVDAGVVMRGVTADGRPYLHVPRLRDHQKVDKRWTPRCFVCAGQRPAGTHPNSPELAQTHASLGVTRQASPELPETRPGKERKVREKYMSTAAGAASDDSAFNEFWTRYPRKEAKAAARKAWRAITKTVKPEVIIAGVQRFKFSDDRSYVPMPASWLSGRRWEDEQELQLPVGTVTANGSRSFTGPQLDEILGVDMWRQPPIPAELTGDVPAMAEWVERQKREHRAQRVQQAIAKMNGGQS